MGRLETAIRQLKDFRVNIISKYQPEIEAKSQKTAKRITKYSDAITKH